MSIGIGSTGTGFNSKNYQYNLFEIKSMDPNIGGSNGSIVVNYESVLLNGPGNIDSLNSSIRIITKNFPNIWYSIDFNAFLDEKNYYKHRKIRNHKDLIGKNNTILETDDTFVAGDVIIGSVLDLEHNS